MTGLAYLVATNDDLRADSPFPPLHLTLGPGRRTVNWRGKRFTIQQPRVSGFEFYIPGITERKTDGAPPLWQVIVDQAMAEAGEVR